MLFTWGITWSPLSGSRITRYTRVEPCSQTTLYPSPHLVMPGNRVAEMVDSK
jgi:hypothetical protein